MSDGKKYIYIIYISSRSLFEIGDAFEDEEIAKKICKDLNNKHGGCDRNYAFYTKRELKCSGQEINIEI
jgi:hypothetical protein